MQPILTSIRNLSRSCNLYVSRVCLCVCVVSVFGFLFLFFFLVFCFCFFFFEIQVSFPQSLSLTQFPTWNHNNTLSLDSGMLDFLAVSPGNPLSPAQTWLWYLFSIHLSASYYSAPRVLSTWNRKVLTLTNFNIGYFIFLCSWISSNALDLFHQHWLRSNLNMANLSEHYPF